MVAETATLPRKPEVAERTLVEDMAETVAPHGFKVVSHTVKEDHERGETSLTVKFVRANPDQPELPGISGGRKKGGADNGDGSS